MQGPVADLHQHEYPGHCKCEGKTYGHFHYKVGQPMGCYSSWPTFALTHGLLIQYCYELIGGGPDTPFVVLGDDVVIFDDRLAAKYKKFLKALDIPISLTKTFESKDFYEFAKRILYKGEEITPFPINAIIEAKHSYFMLYEALRVGEERG